MFIAMEIDDFQTLVNRVTATEAKMKAAERRKSGYRSEKKRKRDDRPQWSSKKTKYQHERSSNYTSAPRSQFTSKPPSVNKSSFTVKSVNSMGNSEKAAPCHGSDHYILDCPQKADQASTRPHVHLNTTHVNKIKSPKQAQSVVQGRGKASHSNAQTHQESQSPARMYHFHGREDEESTDVIAGLDWLGEHQAWIDCYNRRLYLQGLGRESILLIDKKPTSIFAAMALQDEYEFGLPSMHVVSEFIDVFPEELLSLPLMREVKFGIDIRPTITPYRMAEIELK
ncbi:hypothetical protein V6N13_123856 [Hibiscus sabdariffa]